MTNNPKIYIVTEGGGDIGYGHLMRCLSLCQAFAEKNIAPVMLIDSDGAKVKLNQFPNAEMLAWHKNLDLLYNHIKDADVVIVDSLLAPESLWTDIHNYCKVAVLLDDFIRRKHVKGVVVDWTVLADQKFYQEQNHDVTYLLGTKYTALRQEFWDIPPKQISPTLTNILVTFGGSDVANMTPLVVELLKSHYPHADVKVIIGPGFTNLKEIEGLAYLSCELIMQPSASEMVKLMLWADVCISAGGQTFYELARVGTPTIGVQVADNQRDDVSGWTATGFLQFAGEADDPNIKQEIANQLDHLANFELREKVSKIGQTQIDGQGARRLVKAILEEA
ncbi:MAG: UDP-2,4-diacetamido-2,4,6-trideoxy-beta-L-altropyranose hydrolase [Patescibacteria group bacterium]|jgi:UDP-2,4-diacetamido-2,4,6-trideoxy-beta-L-altropyranose hydrolase